MSVTLSGRTFVSFTIAAVALGATPNAALAEGEDIAKPGRLLGVELTRTDPVTLEQKKYAKGVAENLVCLCGTCPREPLSTCDCSWAAKGRKTIELALLDGSSEEAVLAAFRKSFGDKAFAAPPTQVEMVVTVIPFTLVAIMLLVMVGYGLRSAKRASALAPAKANKANKAKPAEPKDDDEASRILRRELEDLD